MLQEIFSFSALRQSSKKLKALSKEKPCMVASLTGPSGSGKSTQLNALKQLDPDLQIVTASSELSAFARQTCATIQRLLGEICALDLQTLAATEAIAFLLGNEALLDFKSPSFIEKNQFMEKIQQITDCLQGETQSEAYRLQTELTEQVSFLQEVAFKMKSGDIVDNRITANLIINEIIKLHQSSQAPVKIMIDGFPRTFSAACLAVYFVKHLICLKASESVLRKRLNFQREQGRAGDSDEATINNRIKNGKKIRGVELVFFLNGRLHAINVNDDQTENNIAKVKSAYLKLFG